MKKLFFAAAAIFFSFSAFAQNTGKLLENYISVKDALVSSDAATAARAIHTLYQSVKEETDFAGKDALLKAAEKLAKTNDIEKQRAAFNDVSTVMWEVVKNSGKADHAVYYQYCPMKKAYWLSNEKEIKNPYYGSAMLTCGKVVETKE